MKRSSLENDNENSRFVGKDTSCLAKRHKPNENLTDSKSIISEEGCSESVSEDDSDEADALYNSTDEEFTSPEHDDDNDSDYVDVEEEGDSSDSDEYND